MELGYPFPMRRKHHRDPILFEQLGPTFTMEDILRQEDAPIKLLAPENKIIFAGLCVYLKVVEFCCDEEGQTPIGSVIVIAFSTMSCLERILLCVAILGRLPPVSKQPTRLHLYDALQTNWDSRFS